MLGPCSKKKKQSISHPLQGLESIYIALVKLGSIRTKFMINRLLIQLTNDRLNMVRSAKLLEIFQVLFFINGPWYNRLVVSL